MNYENFFAFKSRMRLIATSGTIAAFVLLLFFVVGITYADSTAFASVSQEEKKQVIPPAAATAVIGEINDAFQKLKDVQADQGARIDQLFRQPQPQSQYMTPQQVEATWRQTQYGYWIAGDTGISELFLNHGSSNFDINWQNSWEVGIRGYPNSTITGKVNLSGAAHCTFDTIRFSGPVVIGRRGDLNSAGYHRFVNCHFTGPVTIAASEVCVFVGCTFTSISADFVPLTITNYVGEFMSTMQGLDFEACSFISHGTPAVRLINPAGVIMSNINFSGGYLAAHDAPCGFEIITDGQFEQVAISRMIWECPTAEHAIKIGGKANVNMLMVEGGSYNARQRFIYAPGNMLNCCQFVDFKFHSTADKEWELLEIPDVRPMIDAVFFHNTTIRSPYSRAIFGSTPFSANQISG